jgi:hypothetical protein
MTTMLLWEARPLSKTQDEPVMKQAPRCAWRAKAEFRGKEPQRGSLSRF